jgi:hypothetical protein
LLISLEGGLASSVQKMAHHRAAPEPQASIRLAEQVDFARRQVEAPEAELCHSFDSIERKSGPEIFVREQSVDDDSNRVL